jgi:glycosyltransferase involved in cell wall biosynthesis
MPMVILEAMAAGVIPVATAVGAIPSLVQHMSTGMLVHRDIDSVTRALGQLMLCPDLTETLKRQAREHFERHYSPEHICKRYEAVYSDEQRS